MGRNVTLAGALALALFATTAVQAAVPESIHRIAVVNGSDAPMVVLAEDAGGALHEVATLEAGEVKLVETEIPGSDGTALRLHARATDSADRWSTWGAEGIVSDRLDLSRNETAIFWIAPELAESLVEIRGQ